MEYVKKDIPLWQVTTWDKKFNNVAKEWQPKTVKYNYLLSDELDALRVDDGNVVILYTGKDSGVTTEELAGENLSEGEIVSIPWGGIPTVKYCKGKFVTGDNRIATSNDTEELTNKYLYYFMKGNIQKIASFYRGASLKHPCMKDILKMTISYPTVEVQYQICKQFESLENIIKERKLELELLDNLIKARFVEMFENYYKNKIKEKSLCVISRFIDYRGKTPEKSESGIPLITAKNVRNNKFSIVPQEFIPEENYEAVMTRGVPMVNDVLFTTEAPLGNVCRIPAIYEKFCVGQRLITIQPHTDLVNSEYLEYALTSVEFQEKMWQKSSGSTVKGIRSKLLSSLTIPVPPIELQNQFADFVYQVDKSKVAVQKALDEAQLLFDSLMQEYFG